MDEAEALIVNGLMHDGDPDSALEQGWLLRELHQRFGLSVRELAQRFDRSLSWVSRRLSLVKELPEDIQQRVRSGEIPPYAAMKYLVPLARANFNDCLRLVEALDSEPLSSRQMQTLYRTYMAGDDETRERLLEKPSLFLRVEQEVHRPCVAEATPAEGLLSDLRLLGAVGRRCLRRLKTGLFPKLITVEQEQAARLWRAAQVDLQFLADRCEKEFPHAG
jgi:hypothetical protein